MRADLVLVAILVKNDPARNLKDGYGFHGCPPSLRKRSNRRDYSSVVECSFLLPQGSRRQPPLVEYIAPAAAVSRGAGSSTDHGLGVDPGPSSTVAVFVTIRNDMSVDERSLAYAHGGVFVVNARLLVPDLLTGRVLPETLDGLFVNHAHTVGEFSAEAFVLLLYRGRNLRGFLRVVTDRADLLPIEIFRGCVQ